MTFLSDKDLEQASIAADELLKVANLPKMPCYRPKDIQYILNISYPMFITMCDCWEPLEVRNRSKKGLESYRIGAHRRIPHHALVEWIAVNKQG
jgi:hypothetical protein